jgi:hypothetical protein
MTTPVSIRTARPPAFEHLMQAMNIYPGGEFNAARQLVALLEASAPCMPELDRQQLGRLMVTAGHSITQIGKERR